VVHSRHFAAPDGGDRLAPVSGIANRRGGLLKGRSLKGLDSTSVLSAPSRDTRRESERIVSKSIFGTKVGMTQVFGTDGERIPVTVVQAGPCTVIGTCTLEKHKYSAIRVAFREFDKPAEGRKPRWEKVQSKAEYGVFTKLGLTPARVIREMRVEPAELEGVKVGDKITADLFKGGDLVDVTGITKGHGFAGVVFRHKMAGQGAPQSHGAHEVHRHMGAIGQRKTPGRTYKNKRMPGHMGVTQRTIQNLSVVSVDSENNLVLIKGALPGANGTLLTIRPAVKAAARKANRAE
jgi:large subunit ribosomal protein L3